MVEIEFTTLRGAHFPGDQCCNCGTYDGTIKVVETVMRWTMYFGAFGTERRVKVGLPYCDGCAGTAERVPMGFGRRLLVWLSLCIGGIMLAPSIPGVRALGVSGALLIDGAISAAIVWAWATYGARPRDRQTSYYQPVRLRDFGRVLAFTNGDYAGRVAAENRGLASIAHADVPEARCEGGSFVEQARSWFKAAIQPSPRFLRNAERWGLILIGVLVMYVLLWYLRGRS